MSSIQVVGEVLNPLVFASLGFSEAEMALSDVMIANGGSDDELVMGYIRLQMAKEMLPETLSPFRSIPAAFGKAEEALIEAGLGTNPDDLLLNQWIAETGAYPSAIQSTLSDDGSHESKSRRTRSTRCVGCIA